MKYHAGFRLSLAECSAIGVEPAAGNVGSIIIIITLTNSCT